jgi:hypothetical protein
MSTVRYTFYAAPHTRSYLHYCAIDVEPQAYLYQQYKFVKEIAECPSKPNLGAKLNIVDDPRPCPSSDIVRKVGGVAIRTNERIRGVCLG